MSDDCVILAGEMFVERCPFRVSVCSDNVEAAEKFQILCLSKNRGIIDTTTTSREENAEIGNQEAGVSSKNLFSGNLLKIYIKKRHN